MSLFVYVSELFSTTCSEWGLCEYVIVHTIVPPRPVILWIELGGKPKWLPLNSGYHDVMRTVCIAQMHVGSVWYSGFFSFTSTDVKKELTIEGEKGRKRKNEENLRTAIWRCVFLSLILPAIAGVV